MKRRLTPVLMLLVAGCVSRGPVAAPVAAPLPPTPPLSPTGLESVLGASARTLSARFGRPDLEAHEGPARKLQFLSPVCVLDVYLYPHRQGAEPVATHVDARQPDGRPFDRASCAAAISRRPQAR